MTDDRLMTARPRWTTGQEWLVALATGWLIGGAYLDSWAHNHLGSELETFFTPWHAVLYSGFFVLAGYTVLLVVVALRRGSPLRGCVPHGYGLSLVGIGIFAVGGMGDMFWHEIFGIEIGVEGALSATHQLLDLGTVLTTAGPARAAWRRADTETGWARLGPMVISATLTVATLTLISQIAHPFTQTWALLGSQPPDSQLAFAAQVVGVIGTLLQSGLLIGVILLLIGRWEWRLPPGGLVVIVALPLAAITLMVDEYRLIPAALIGGIAAEALRLVLKPSFQRRGALAAFAVSVPAVIYLAYFITLVITDDVWWRIHTISGAVAAAAIAGLLLSVLASSVRREG